MSTIEAKLESSETAFHVEAYEKIEYSLVYVNGVFDTQNPELADCYQKYDRCLAVIDANVNRLYGKQLQSYFITEETTISLNKLTLNIQSSFSNLG